MLKKIIFLFGSKISHPKLQEEIQRLLKSDFDTRTQILQTKKNKERFLFELAKENSKFYSNHILENLGLDPNFKLEKNQLILKRKDFETECEKKVTWVETSGTSGQTLYFPKGQLWDTINRAVMYKCYSWYNVNPWDRNGYFWGFERKGIKKYKTLFLDFLQNRFRLFSYDRKEVERFLKKLKRATYLHGYSSMIYETAKIALELGYKPADFPKLKMIKGTSEKIHPFYQEAVIKAFGKKIVSEYGAAETGIIAFECPNGNMHINEENVIVEQDENGEIIVTNLNSFSFPIIRYALGDKVKISSFEKCSCGRQSDIIEEIEGRVGKKIIGFSNQYPSLTLYYIFKNLALNYNIQLQYQGFQCKKGVLDLRFPIVINEQVQQLILGECKNYFNDDMNVNIVYPYEIHTKKSKLRDFISELE
jgi:phenylacetate-CoA ligase